MTYEDNSLVVWAASGGPRLGHYTARVVARGTLVAEIASTLTENFTMYRFPCHDHPDDYVFAKADLIMWPEWMPTPTLADSP